MERFLEGEAATLAFGRRLAALAPPRLVIFLHGELGAGKTTLVRGFLHGLGHEGTVKSPTYTLVEPYALGHRHVYHFDLYRLADPEELEYMGIRDFFREDAVCLVEWAERGAGFLPTPDLDLQLIYERAGHRRLHLEADTHAGHHLLRQLAE